MPDTTRAPDDPDGGAPADDAAAARTRTLFATMPVGVVYQDADGRITAANPAAERLLGLSLAQLQGRTSLDARWRAVREDGSDFPGEHHPAMVALRTGRPVHGATMGVFHSATDETRWLRIDATPILDPESGVAREVFSTFLDITEARRAQLALHKSEERYRLLLQNANDAVCVHELTATGAGAVIEVNDCACELLGYTREELLQLDVTAIGCPEQRSRDAAVTERLLETGHAIFETEYVRKDGSRVPVEASVSSLSLGGRRIALSVVRDITVRHAAQAGLRQLKAMRDASESISRAGSWGWSAATGATTWSPEMFRLFDVAPTAFQGDFAPILEARLHPEDRAALSARTRVGDRAELAEALAGLSGGAQPRAVELRVIHRDGSQHVLSGKGGAERDAAGHLVGISGYFQDVTEQRLTEQALREAGRRFLSLFEQSPVAIWEEDLSAVRERLELLAPTAAPDWAAYFASHPEEAAGCTSQMRVLDVNQASLRLFGVAGKHALLGDPTAFFTDETHRAFAELLASLAQGERQFSAEIQIETLAGETRQVELSLAVVAGHEETLDRVLLSFVDVTARRRAEAEIGRLVDELQRRVEWRTAQRDLLDHELEAVAYSAAHDLRTPLRAIDGFSAVVLEDAGERLTEDEREHLRRVREAAQHMGHVIDDISRLSSMSRGDVIRTDAGQVPSSGVSRRRDGRGRQAAGSAVTSLARAVSAGIAMTTSSDSIER